MKKILLIATLAFSLFSCNDEERLANDTRNEGPEIVGFNKSVENVAYFSNVGQKTLDVPVVMQGLGDGLAPVTPIAVSYEIDLANSTAVKGTEFDFADATGKVTIPAGGSFANIPLLINTGSFNATQKTELVLKLTSASSGVVGEQYKSIKIIFVGCATALEGNYNTYLVSGPTSTFAGAATVVKIAPNVYRCSRLPGISSGGQPLTFDFSDVCRDLEIIDWQFEGSYPMFKTGTTDRPTGIIESPSGNLVFTEVNLTGLSFYVNRNFTLVRI
ncbi:hypothetical protein SAMN05660845_0374 [Flavobacterium swingsii]|jgi:hypothetical protein|uniref:Calx-beta domain-containing protein n=1 Tax=Flavobacterium swingsii TaxID=498292 RepID=A0A1I0VFW9_9FLAO|nr:hypothetical protein [Flavobacterium swingsii]SFA75255.1 hypothetical protein SAMN05660845_0374 [Flavobacterium swingsii]